MQAPLDTSVEYSALQSTEFSRMVSALGPSGFDNKSIGTLSTADAHISVHENRLKTYDLEESSASVSHCSKNTCHCVGNELIVTPQEAKACLCYSCRLISREMVCVKTCILLISEC